MNLTFNHTKLFLPDQRFEKVRAFCDCVLEILQLFGLGFADLTMIAISIEIATTAYGFSKAVVLWDSQTQVVSVFPSCGWCFSI